MGEDNLSTRVLFAFALITGVVLTTMPITVIGDAFASSWAERKQLEIAARVQAKLLERGLEVDELIHGTQQMGPHPTSSPGPGPGPNPGRRAHTRHGETGYPS
jgi:hypothetical protein